jgi:hypothetical protein
VGFHWKRLLREGCHTDDVVRFAERLLSETPRDRLPSLAGFLARFEDYLGKIAPPLDSSSARGRIQVTTRTHRSNGNERRR